MQEHFCDEQQNQSLADRLQTRTILSSMAAVFYGGVVKSSALARWMRWLHTYSAMLVLLLLLFFAITGITLNHPELSSSLGKTSQQLQLELPEQLPDLLNTPEDQQQTAIALYVDWLKQEHQLQGGYNLSFSPEDELLEVDFKRPAGYAAVVIDLAERTAELDAEFGGYLALANDLHKGRYAGSSWKWLIDITAVFCVLFALSGFYLLWRQPNRRDFGNATAVAGLVLALLAYIASFH